MATPKVRKNTRRKRVTKAATSSKPSRSRLSKAVSKTSAAVDTAAPTQKHGWRRKPKSERPLRPKLPTVWRLSRSAYDLLALNWRLIIGIALVYGFLNILLVRGLNGGLDVSQLKSQFSQLYGGGWGNLASAFSIFASLVSSSNNGKASDAASTYQSFLVLITSLALVWNFRQLLADKTASLRIRDGFYKGMYPLTPVIIICLIISLQLIPMLIGGVLFSMVMANGIAVTAIEIVVWTLLLLISVVLSLLLITPSIFALYIASLPDMTPIRALRSAKKLVRFRRATVLRKVLFLPLLIFMILSAVILPIIFVVPVLAQWVFFGLSMFILPSVHAYLYTLYRELLNE